MRKRAGWWAAALFAGMAPVAYASTVADGAGDLGQPLATAPTAAAAEGGTSPPAILAGATLSAAPPASPTSGLYVGLTGMSDYRYDGFSESNLSPTWQITLHYFRSDGYYAGTVITHVIFLDQPPTHTEVDLYLGKHIPVAGMDLNLEVLFTTFPDQHTNTPSYGFVEPEVGLAKTFRKLTVESQVGWSPLYSGALGQALHLKGTASYAVTDWLRVSGHAGRLWVEHGGKSRDLFDVGATATWKKLSFDARYGGTDLTRDDCYFTNWCRAGAYFTLTYQLSP